MRELFLIVHFIGLAMGLGTSLAFMFLARAASKMEPQRARQFSMDALPLSRMGQIGLGILIFSGLYLMTPHWATLSSRPLLIIKLLAVLVLAVVIGLATVVGKKIKKGGGEQDVRRLQSLGKVSLLTALAIVVLAVSIFH